MYLINPFDAEATFVKRYKNAENFEKPFKPCHVGIHWKALDEFYHMSSHLPGFQSFSHFVFTKLATSSIRVNENMHNIFK